jgi:hypothetical protein
MAGGFMKGGKRDLDIVKKPIPNNPSYPPVGGGKTKIEKESATQLTTVNVPAGILKIGVRIKRTEKVEQFEISGRNGQRLTLTPAPPNETPAPDPIAVDLATTFGVGADEKWVAYTTDLYDPRAFGKKFDTKLVLNPFECHPNGLRVMLVAATFQALSFANDHYVYGLSVLPGENSRALTIDIGAGATRKASKKPAKKTPKTRPGKRRRK